MLDQMLGLLSFLLFVFEIFVGTTILFMAIGARSLAHKDMLGLRNGVVFAGLTLTTSSMVVPTDLWAIETILAIHHFYCYINWNTSPYTQKILWWSSLNYTKSRSKEWTLYLCMTFNIITRHSQSKGFTNFTYS